jgi:hypothetical protein
VLVDSPPIAGTLSRLLASLACLVALALALTGSAAANAPPLRGAVTHPLWADSSVADFDRELDLLAAAGANTVRIDLGWSSLEPDAKGQHAQWYVDKADTFLAHARARGLRTIVTLFTTPCWASSAPDTIKQGCAGNWWEREVGFYPPTNPADFADAAAFVAQRWGDSMSAIEIWNEPNYDFWFRSAVPAVDYAAMLRAAYTRIKQVKPALPVLGPAMLASDGPFLEALYAQGVRGYFDGLSLRPFNQGRSPYDSTVPPLGLPHVYLLGVPWIRSIMVAHGDAAKRMWFTEVGWSSCAPGPNIWCITQDLQARYVADAFRIIRDRWDYVQAVTVYNLRNKGTDPLDRETQMGLVHRDFTPKPSYFAFRDVLAEMARQPYPLPPAAPADVKRPVLSRLKVFVRRGGRRLVVTYRLSERARVSLRLARAAERRRCRRRCVRWVSLRRPIVRAGQRGKNRRRLSLAGVDPGRYRLTATATDRAGNRSAPKRASFRRRTAASPRR